MNNDTKDLNENLLGNKAIPNATQNVGSNKRSWKYYTVCACLYIFFLSFKPSEPHLTRYLEAKGFVKEEINNQIYPWWTYSYLPLLLIIGLFAESLRYTPVIIVGSLGRLVARVLLIYGESLFTMQVVEVAYAFGSVAEVIFYAYIYHLVTPQRYQLITSFTQFAYMAAHVSGGLFGDMMLHWMDCNITTLFWISLISVLISVILCLATFPMAPVNFGEKFINFKELGHTLKRIGKRGDYMVLCCWWVCAGAIFQLFYGYESSLYTVLLPNTKNDYNGTIWSIAMSGGALTALLPGIKKLKTRTRGRSVQMVAIAWFVGTICLFVMSYTGWISALVAILLFFACWEFAIAVFYTETARVTADLSLPEDTDVEEEGLPLSQTPGEESSTEEPASPPYSSVFVITTVTSLCVQTLLQFLLTNKATFDVDTLTLFRVLSFVGLGVFVIIFLSILLKGFRKVMWGIVGLIIIGSIGLYGFLFVTGGL